MFDLLNSDSDLSSDTVTAYSIIYLYTDHLMTNRLATNQTQAIIWHWEGEAFGNTPANELAGIPVNLRFPGQYYDQETNLHYNMMRYYDPQIGRYITSDPIGLDGGMNTYEYAVANSLRFIDPFGLFTYNAFPPQTEPLSGEALGLAKCVETCLGQTFIVSGGSECTNDGRHTGISKAKNSKHCPQYNQAFDMWKKGFPRKKLLCCMKKCGGGYAEDEGNHWHFQTVPGRNGESGALNEVECDPICRGE